MRAADVELLRVGRGHQRRLRLCRGWQPRAERLQLRSLREDTLQPLAPGAYQFVAYTQEAVGTLRLEVGTLAAGEDSEAIVARAILRAADTVESRVVDGSGTAVGGARVMVVGRGEYREPFLHLVTDSAGVVRVPVLPVGEQELCVMDQTGRIVGQGALVAGGRVVVQ